MIFISYKRGDVPGHVLKLFSTLSDKYTRQRVFLDTGQLAVGERWPDAIDKALNSSIIFFCAIGAKWNSRDLHEPGDYVRREISTALARGKPVVPLLFDGARLPARDDLPEDCRGMLDHQVMVFDPYDLQLYEDKLQKLLGSVEAMTKTLSDSGDPDATCRLYLEISSNKGKGGVGFKLLNPRGDLTLCEWIPVSGSGTQRIAFPIGPHTLKITETVTSVSRMSGFSSSSSKELASHTMFFEAGDYTARLERYELPWPMNLYDRYKFYGLRKR
jgi:hypothetical protein